MNLELNIKNLSHRFEERVILDGLNLELPRGQIYSILGATGVGKSLLLRLIASIEKVQTGEIRRASDKLSFVFQNQSFIPWLSIRKNFDFTQVRMDDEFISTLKKFKLDNFLDSYPSELSGGTLQKLSLVRAFLDKHSLVLLDEPFSHIDYVQKYELYEFMLELWKSYRPSILMVTHDIEEALLLSDKVSLISQKDKAIKFTIEIDREKEIQSAESLSELKWTHLSKERFMHFYKHMLEDLR